MSATLQALTPPMRRVIRDAIYRSSYRCWQVAPVMSGATGRVMKALKDRELVEWLSVRDGAAWVLTDSGARVRDELLNGLPAGDETFVGGRR